MKVLSIDVGIKNLAICVLETNSKGFNIVFWNVINLSEEKSYICNCLTQNKKTYKPCSKTAQFFKDENFYCKTHANSSNLKLPTSTINKYKSLKIDELNTLCNEHDIIIEKNTKASIYKQIEEYIEKNILYPIKKLNCNTINLIDIGKSIKNNLDKLELYVLSNIDYILIENQISPIANRMNSIQGMISQYFIMKDIEKILFVSASNKLKNFLQNKKTSYNERKKISIDITKQILLENNMDNVNKEKIIDMFNKHKKRDDLADAFLQGIWFLSQDNKVIANLGKKNEI